MVEAQIFLNWEEILNVAKGKWECPWLTPRPFWFNRLLTCCLHRLWSACSTFSILLEALSTISWIFAVQDQGQNRGKGTHKVSHPTEIEQILEILCGEVCKSKHPSNLAWPRNLLSWGGTEVNLNFPFWSALITGRWPRSFFSTRNSEFINSPCVWSIWDIAPFLSIVSISARTSSLCTLLISGILGT